MRKAAIITCVLTFPILFFAGLTFYFEYGDRIVDRIGGIKRWLDSRRNPPIRETKAGVEDLEPQVQPPLVLKGGIQVGDRVIVMKAPSHLLIRSKPKKTAKRIGHAKNRATGTVKEGPRIGLKGLTWFRIEWDKEHTIGWNRKVVFYRRNLGNQKWSVEKNEKGTRHLKKTTRR